MIDIAVNKRNFPPLLNIIVDWTPLYFSSFSPFLSNYMALDKDLGKDTGRYGEIRIILKKTKSKQRKTQRDRDMGSLGVERESLKLEENEKNS